MHVLGLVKQTHSCNERLVQITKEFPLAKSSQMWKGNELSNVLASKWTGRLGSAVGMNFTSDSPPSTLTGAIEGLFTIAYASWTAGFLGARLFHVHLA